MVSILQSKDIDWSTGLTNETWTFFCLQEIYLTGKDKHRLNRKRSSKQMLPQSKQE
jgi:hypothetical protein